MSQLNRKIKPAVVIRQAIVLCFLGLSLLSCQKNDNSFFENNAFLKDANVMILPDVSSGKSLLLEHTTFKRTTGEPCVESLVIEATSLDCYNPDIVLMIRNGNDKVTRVASAEIKINGELVAGPSDFSKNVASISKPLSGLTPRTSIEVKLSGNPGSFIELWIEGTQIIVTPEFNKIAPVLANSDSPVIPVISENGIRGKWDPTVVNTTAAGAFTFTFTPDEGQCAKSATMVIEVKDKISDIEGNSYKIVRIGNQYWMAENLRTSHYRNGDLIATTIPGTLNVSGENAPKYQWPAGGNENNVSTYGRLYTWYAITDSRNICPDGWHIPSDAEWSTLNDYLVKNGYGYQGSGTNIIKSLAANNGWIASTTPGTPGNDQVNNNKSAFNGIPGGYRVNTGGYVEMKISADWWSATESNVKDAFYLGLAYNRNVLLRSHISKSYGGNVRCVKD
jgi:uncharacterized protein (TIGR02145 family)